MTLEEIKDSTKDILLAKDVCELLKCNPDTLRRQAQQDPSMLGFPTIVMGTRVKIPRIPFIKYIEGEV